jgi:hypothetical protein
MNDHIRYESCIEYSTYLSRLAAYSGSGMVPVLGPRTPVMEAVEKLSSPEPQRPIARPGRMMVVHSRAPGLQALAEALASCMAGTACACEDAGQIGRLLSRYPACDYIVFLGVGEDVTADHLAQLHNQLWEMSAAGLGPAHLGVVTGRNIPELAWVIAKGLAFPWRNTAPSGHVRIWPAVQELRDRIGTGEWILGNRALSAETAPMLLGQHNGAVSFLGHGRDDVLHLHDTVICPGVRHSRNDLSLTQSRVPVCAFTGQCYRPDVASERIIRADEVCADVVLANSCLSWRAAGGLFMQDYLLAYAFMSGTAAAYVGSPTLLAGSALVNDLYHQALAQGRSVGQAVSLINDHLRGERTDPPYFTLLGLPWVTPGASADWPPAAKEKFISLHIQPELAQTRGRLASVGLASAALGRTGHSARLVYVSDRTSSLIGTMAAAPDDVQTADGLGRELRGLGRAIVAIANTASLGFRYSRQNNLLVNLHDQISNLARVLTTAATSGEAEKVGRRVSSLREAVARAELTLAESFYERGTTSFASFVEMWGPLLEQVPFEASQEKCPYCSRLLLHRRAVHPLFDRVSRSCLECSRCGMVLDRDPHGPIESMELATEELWHHGQEIRITLRITASRTLDRNIQAYAAVHTEASSRNQIHFPPVQRVSLMPGLTTDVDVAVDLPATARMHQEFLRGLVVAEGTLNCACRPVWIRPALDRETRPVVDVSR